MRPKRLYLYLYYGNPTAAAASNGDATFILFDDFSGSTLDASKWVYAGGDAMTISGGTISISGGSEGLVESVNSYPGPYISEVNVLSATGNWPNLAQADDDLYNTGATMYLDQPDGVMWFGNTANEGGTIYEAFLLSDYVDGSLAGVWSVVRTPSAGFTGTWPGGSDTYTGTNANATAANQYTAFGPLDGGTGSMSVDWFRARQYYAPGTIQTVGAEVPADNPPTFTSGSSQTLTVCENSGATSINSLLQIDDADVGQTETWTVTGSPSNGSITPGATATSNGGDVSPTGWTYTPNTGYSGSDAFTVGVSDGAGGTASITIDVTVNGLPGSITGPTTIYTTGTATLTDAGGGTWSSDNTSAVSIDPSSGIYTGEGVGTADITYMLPVTSCATSVVVTDTTAVPGSALNFDGVSTYVETLGTSVLNQVPMTVEAWVQPLTRSDGTDISQYPSNAVSDDQPDYYGQGFGANILSNGQSFITVEYHQGWDRIPYTMTSGQWYHISVVYTPGDVKTYVGSTLIHEVTFSQGPMSGQNLIEIGKHNNDGSYGSRRFFLGSIDQVKIWDRALCEGEIANDMNCTLASPYDPTLQAYFPMAEGLAFANNSTVTTNTDVTGDHNDGTLYSFVLNGTTSNWVTPGGVTTGVYCTPWTPPTATVTAGGATTFCVGGSVALSANSGSGYSYQWTNGSGNISGATDQIYTTTETTSDAYAVTVTEDGNCTATSAATSVTVNALPVAGTISGGSVTLCAGTSALYTNTGAANGTGSWSSDNTAVATVDGSGNVWGAGVTTTGTANIIYTVTSGFTPNCGAASTSSPITVNPVPVAGTISGAGSLCTGSSTGYSDATFANGTGSWSSDNTSVATVDPVAGTVYGVSSGTADIIFTVTSGFTPACSSASTSVVITINGLPYNIGGGPYAYAWTVTGGGAYCAGASGAIVGLGASESGVNYQLYNGASAIGTAQGGTGAAVSFGYQTEAGTYLVIATNGTTGCYDTMPGNPVISINPVPTVTAVAGQADCNNTTQGAITFSGSVAGTTFSWANNNTAIGLGAGGATGTVWGSATEEGGSITLTAPAGAVFTSVTFASYGTPGGSDGSFTLGGCNSPNSQSVVESYLLGNNSATIPVNNDVFTDPCFGTLKTLSVLATYTYTGNVPSFTATNTGSSPIEGTITVTPTANGCIGTPGTFNVTVNPLPAVAVNATNINCNTANPGPSGSYSDGTETATVTGLGGYSYAWSAPITTTTSMATGLTMGTYSVTVTDGNGCVNFGSATVSEPAAVGYTSVTATNITCNDINGGVHNNGTATVNGATGGTGSFTYLWSNGETTNPATTLTGPATYSVTISDGNSCTTTGSAIVGQPSALVYSTTVDNVNCYGWYTGFIGADVSGGVWPYDYSWSTGGAGIPLYSDLFFAPAGTYTVTATDANGCSVTASYNVTQPAALTLSATSTNVSCHGGSNGTISTTVTGGTTAYSYYWSGGASGADPTGLSAGTYLLTVTDAHGCIIGNSYSISQPSAISISGTIGEVSCNGGTNGSIATTVTGGTSGYSYAWSPGGATSTGLTSKAAGTYSVTVTDAHSCTASSAYTITQPALLSVSATVSGVSCHGGSTGSITTTVSGGTSGYSYAWAPGGSTSANLTGKTAGTYSVTVTDAHSCTTGGSYTISQPTAALSVSGTITNVTCYGGDNGSITTTVTGGTASYSYAWSPCGGTTSGLSGKTAGTYGVTVTDAHGCTASGSYTITQPGALGCSITVTPGSSVYTGGVPTNIYLGYGSQTATLTATATGGSGYSYSWSSSEGTSNLSNTHIANPVFTASSAGSYTYVCTITSESGCTTTCSVSICVTDAVDHSTSGHILVCHGYGCTPATLSCTSGSVPTYIVSSYCPSNHLGAVGSGCSSELSRESGDDANSPVIDGLTVTAFPNPFTSEVSVKIASSLEGNADLQLFDVTGRVRDTKLSIDANSTVTLGQDLVPGVYIVEVHQGGTTRIVKVVKN